MHEPDPRFPAPAIVLSGDGEKTIIVFMPPHGIVSDVTWRRVPDTLILVVGDIDEALAGLIENYSNKEWQEKMGLHPSTLRKLRQFLGIAANSTGGRGGQRPGAGARRKE